MRNFFQDLPVLSFLFSEAFAIGIGHKGSFFGDSPSLSRRENNTESIPSPIVVPPSQYWDGDDGEWSTFALRVGSPAQNVRVLVSTNSPQTMVVLSQGCTTQAINPPPADCANSRGGLFSTNASTTWDDQGLYGINGDGVGLEANLGYVQNAEYGLETVGLGYVAGGQDGPTLKNQTVAGIASVSPLYMGVFGLSTQPVNYSTIGNYSAPSYFTSLRSQKLIPSLGWSYTAGAKYRLKNGQFGQLIFGGYDTSRFTPNAATFTLAGDIDRDIVVAIQSITFSGTTQSSLLSSPIFAFIESTDTNLWLPAAACQSFEKAFGLLKDNNTGLYLINNTHYAQLQTENPQVTFALANGLSGGQTVNIVLPFSAFALSASYPLTPNSTYYFPLKVAANDTQYTLGRTFLQEAYLTVDYERGNFSISQCLWNDGAPSEIAAIISSSYTTNFSSTASPGKKSSSTSVSPAVVAGVVVGVIAIIAVCVLGVLVVRRKKRPISTTPTENLGLSTLNKVKADEDKMSVYPPDSPLPGYKKDDPASSIYRSSSFVDSELGTMGEIHQLPEAHHMNEEDYLAAARRMESQRRAGQTTELGGRAMMYEVMGDLPTPAEMDDQGSREGLLLSPSRAASGNGSRPTSSRSDRSRVTGPVPDHLSTAQS